MNSDDEVESSLKNTLDGLTPPERRVLRQRFGIHISSDAPLAETVKQFDITREKIRDIEKKALKKLDRDDDPDDAA